MNTLNEMESDSNISRTPSLPYKATQTPPYSTQPHVQSHHLLRISDILRDPDAEDEDIIDDAAPMVGCVSSPRRVVGRWLSGLRRGKVKSLLMFDGERKNEKGGNLIGKERNIVHRAADDVGSGGTDGGDSPAESSSVSVPSLDSGESGLIGKESSFNLAMGCCLLYLAAASKNELSKMIEARMQAEMLLQNVRDELRTKDAMSKQSKPDDVPAYSTTDCDDHPFTQVSLTSYALPESPSITMTSQSLIDETPKREQLEAELKTELERLELNFDEDTLSGDEDEQSLLLTMGDTVSSKSTSVDSGEVIDPQGAMAITELQGGVRPYELERKLHELLESRQEEQIRELETAVEHLRQQLLEKEIEVSWWKDTARVISKHIPVHSRLSLQHKLEPLPSRNENVDGHLTAFSFGKEKTCIV